MQYQRFTSTLMPLKLNIEGEKKEKQRPLEALAETDHMLLIH